MYLAGLRLFSYNQLVETIIVNQFIFYNLNVRQQLTEQHKLTYFKTFFRSQATPVQVVLAPYGLSGSLTGVSYKSADHSVAKLLKDWERFYPLDRNKYITRDTQGDFVSMPAAVEVLVAGVRFKYPTCYVLVTDLDVSAAFEPTSNIAKAVHASRDSGKKRKTLSQDRFCLNKKLTYRTSSSMCSTFKMRSTFVNMSIFPSLVSDL